MKNLFVKLTLFLVVLAYAPILSAQQKDAKGKAKKENTQVVKETADEKIEVGPGALEEQEDEAVVTKKKQKKQKAKKAKGNKAKGNAFGRNKNGLSGKEFGQERASQAKLNKEEKALKPDEDIDSGEDQTGKSNRKTKKSGKEKR